MRERKGESMEDRRNRERKGERKIGWRRESKEGRRKGDRIEGTERRRKVV
jgi:hypothetical protein